MVQDLERTCSKSSSRSSETALDKNLAKLNCRLNSKVRQIQKRARKLSQIDTRTESVTRPLEHFPGGIVFKPLGEASLGVDESDRTIILNSKIIEYLVQTVPKQLLHEALLVFLCHEVSHIAQRLKFHDDVQRMKEVDQGAGQQRMGEIDLRSDFLAVYTLSIFHTLEERRTYTHEVYIRWFHTIWHDICRAMLGVFPTGNRKDKQQRVFGYLLMSNLIGDAYTGHYPLEFNAELWPNWSPNLDRLSIYSNGYPLVSGSKINSALMQQVLKDISEGGYSSASSGIRDIWKYLPRR